jgi:ATP-dependent DNA helicase RecG
MTTLFETITSLKAQVTAQDERMNTLVEFCSIPRSRDEMQARIGIEHREYFRKAFLKPLLESGRLQMTQSDKPNSRNQKYVATEHTDHQ